MIIFRNTPPDFNRYLDEIEQIGPEETHIRTRTPEYSDFPVGEYRQRYARLKRLMELEEIDAIIATQEENLRYFSGYTSVLWISKFRPYFAILPVDPSKSPTLVIPPQERGNAEATSWISDPRFFPAQEPPIPYLVRALGELGLHRGRVGIELGFGQRLGMNQQQFAELDKSLPHVELVDATPLMQTVRMLKSEREMEYIAVACKLSEDAAEVGWKALHPGMTERELMAIMTSKMYEMGAEVSTRPSFFACMAGERWHLSNAVSTDNMIRQGDLVMIDAGATYKGYACDFIRQASLGPLTKENQHYFDAVMKATEQAIEEIRPGIPCYQIYNAAMASLEQSGVKQFNRQNIIGHGLGQDVHEVPWLGEREKVYTSNIRLRKGMVLAVEPGLVPPMPNGKPGHHVVEEIVTVTEDGSQLLTSHLSKEVWIVEGISS